MAYIPHRHRRRSIRLKGYDYSWPGIYFVTICTRDRVCLFGEVEEGVAHLNTFGRIAETCWDALPQHFSQVVLDAFVVMPNHVHGLIGIAGTVHVSVGATHASPLRRRPDASQAPRGPKPRSLGAIVGSFKSAVARHVNRKRGTLGAPVWQRGYYERVVHHERALEAIRRYIAENPLRWHVDRYGPRGQPPCP